MNQQFKTVLLLSAIAGLFLWIGHMIGGQAGMMTALVMSMVMNLGAYWFSDKMVLAMHGAKPIAPHDDRFGVYAMVQELSAKAGLPMPKVYLIPDHAPNAFATGRNAQHGAVAVTAGLLRILNPRELRGVLAHEIGHIKNHDILISTIVACFASAVMYLAHTLQWIGLAGGGRSQDQEGGERGGGLNPIGMILTVIAAPIVATLIQSAISRTREYLADESGADVSDDPEALASALEKIADPDRIKQFQQQEAMPDMQPAFSHLYIVNHFAGENLMSWFSTHPPVKERVKRLREMAVQKQLV